MRQERHIGREGMEFRRSTISAVDDGALKTTSGATPPSPIWSPYKSAVTQVK